MPPQAPTHLRVNDVAAPVGTDASVYFGWLVHDPDPEEIQSTYQRLVASSAAKLADDEGDVWDSGQVASRLQNHAPYSDAALQPDRRYHWKIRIWDKSGAPGIWSATATFTVGPLRNEDWAGASWIRRDSTEKNDYTHYRKTFALPAQPIERATLYASAVHKYTVYLNANSIGQGAAYQYPQYLLIRPLNFADKLSWAKDHITTDRGPISVSWIRSAAAASPASCPPPRPRVKPSCTSPWRTPRDDTSPKVARASRP